MRLLILTTATPHHSFFVRELAAVYPQLHVIIESTGLSPPFDVHHPFEQERDSYEQQVWFGGVQVAMRELAETFTCENVNQSDCISHIAELRPEATIVFGTRKLSRPVIEAAGANMINLHGGDPEYYRGLDSHLWAIYHGDYSNLVTTLHTVNEVLDDGKIIGIRPIPLVRDMKLHELRRRNTECALRLTVDAIGELVRSGVMPSRAQRQNGRYYSFMPAVLKAQCVKKFERYCASLK
jgi:methionyl-tRNA formyltransferase